MDPRVNYGPTQTSASQLLGNRELKHSDTALGATDISTTGFVLNPTLISQNTTANGRIGNVIMIKSVAWEYFFSAADATNFVYGYFLACPNGQAAAPSFSTWYTPPDDDQYIVLRKKQVLLQSGANGGPQIASWAGKHTFPGNGLLVHYDSSVNTSEIINRLSFSFVSDSGVITHPTVTGFFRVTYTDA